MNDQIFCDCCDIEIPEENREAVYIEEHESWFCDEFC
jgi:hypothetical protein